MAMWVVFFFFFFPAVSGLSLANCVAWGKLLNISVLSLLTCKAKMVLVTFH